MTTGSERRRRPGTGARGRGRWAPALVTLLIAAACGGGTSDGGEGGGSGGDGADAAGDCRPEALDEAVAEGGPVEITLWHAYTEATEEAVVDLADEFNAAQDDVQVRVINQAGEDNMMTKMIAGRATGDLPDVTILTDIELQRAIDAELSVPVEPCIEATGFDLSDFLPQALDYYTIGDVQRAMPFNVASPVLLYNVDVFEQAGLDPEQPPETLAELHDMARDIRDAGFEAGFGLQRYAWYFEQHVALGGDTYVDNGNGREERATSVTFGEGTGAEVFEVYGEMMADGSASTSASGSPDHLFGLGEGRWGMATSSSSALGTVYQLLSAGQYDSSDFDVAPMPGATEDGGVVVGGGALHMISPYEDRDPVKEAAAWRFIEFMSTVESSARWAAETGYVPVRISAVDEQVLQDRWAEAPYFRVAYDQLVDGPSNEATAGAVVGEMEAVRGVVEEAWRRMDAEGVSAADALQDAVREADELIAGYNERL